MTKRHAKPTTAQLVARIYRKLIAIEANQADIGMIALDAKEAIGEMRIESRATMGTVKILTDHCARLLREKETLMKRVQLKEANDFMARVPTVYERVPGELCVFAHLHRENIECGVCGRVGP